MTIGVYSFEIHLPGAGSLKNKRQVSRRIKDRLRSRFNLSVCETGDHGNLWQRAAFVAVAVAAQRNALDRMFESVHRELQGLVPGEVIETGCEFIEGVDGGPSGWQEEWR